jgi:hypothetical protein
MRLGFTVESPVFATLFLLLRKPIFASITTNGTQQKGHKVLKKTAAKRMGLLIFGPLCVSCTSLYGMKLSIDT